MVISIYRIAYVLGKIGFLDHSSSTYASGCSLLAIMETFISTTTCITELRGIEHHTNHPLFLECKKKTVALALQPPILLFLDASHISL